MFEGYVVYYLNQYLGRYVDGIDQKSLRISIYKGDVVLKNLQLKPEALDGLDLPVTVRAGLLGSLTLKVPWSSLGAVPVEVKVDRLYLLASPKTEEERGKGVKGENDIEPAFQAAKRARVEAQEARWVAEMEAMAEQQDKMKREGKEQGGGVGGMLKAVIDTVIGNLQLSITNVHIRYEDALTNPEHPFACGITLDRIGGYTVDESGKEAFVTNNPLQTLRKALLLSRMAFYFDTDAEFWRPPADWRGMAPHDWDEWFQPGISAQRQERGGTARHRQYVLQPVDGRALYTRRGAGVQHKDDQAHVEMDFQLDVVALRLSRWQYQSYHLLLAEVSSFTARLGHSAYRPLLRPAAGEPARVWWRYAVKAVQQQQSARKLTWKQALTYARMRVEYVPAYADYLRSKETRAREELRPPRLPQGVQDMDLALPEQAILMFRRMAHAKVQRERRRRAAQEAAENQARGGGWLGWLRGGAAAAPGITSADPLREDAVPELTAEEYGKLVELVESQEQGLRLSNETPFTLLTRISARVGSASALLVGPDDNLVLRGGLEGIQLTLSKYPETLRADLGVTAMGVESPEGTFIRTGAALHRLGSDTDLSVELSGGGGGAPAGGEQRALAVAFVQRPQDGSADALLDVVLTPSYVYYSATAIERVVGFFKTPEQLDFSSLSAQATTQLERARRLAAQYAAAALQSRPRLKLHMVLDAPKVAVPAADARGRVTLALDFGRFIIESDSQTAGKLPAEEAALYECVRLNVCDVAAFLADGEFDWQRREALEGSGRLVPLLERTGMDIALQAARFVDPARPVIRLQPTIPRLHLHLSPGRMGRLLRVVNAALPEGDGAQEGGGPGGVGGGAAGQEAWRQHAEHEGEVQVLTWGGIGRTSAVWCSRYAIVYQGQLYLYESGPPGARLAASENVWSERRAVRVPPGSIGGVEHVVALCPESQDLTRLAESPSCLLLRLASEQAAERWLRRLQEAQQTMRELAGEGGVGMLPDWDETSSTVSGAEVEESREALSAAQGPAQAPAQAPSTVLQLEAELGELAIFGSGREPSLWWPPEEAGGEAAEGEGCSAAAAIVNVDGEVALIVLRASGGTCRFTYGPPGMTVHTALGSLEIEDLLVGPRCARNRFLASSAAGVEPVGEDVFFDADDRLAGGGASSRSSSGSLTPRGASSLPSDGLPAERKDLAEFTFKLCRLGSPEYEGVDTSLDVTLSSLYFYCNRPTVAALITMGLDIGAAATTASAGSDGEAGGGDATASDATCKVETNPGVAAQAVAVAEGAVEGVSAAAGGDEAVDQVGLLGSAGAGERSMFRLTASLGTLQVALNYEGSGCHRLSQASVDDFTFTLDVRPDTSMLIHSELGNVRALDCTLPPDHPYHQACGLRSGSAASLVSLDFCSFPASTPHPKVPPGLQYYTLQARLSELQLVFLYRFLQENLTYISTMLAMRLPPPDQPREATAPLAGSTSQSKGLPGPESVQPEQQASQAQAPAQPFVLLMDVSASAPNILLPRNSGSLDGIEVDLGQLTLNTSSILQQPARGSRKPLLVEAVGLCFSGVGCTVVQGGRRGSNILHNAESGWQLHWRRPLQPELRGEQPMFDLSLEVPSLKARLDDNEYQLITSAAADNFAELPELPEGPAWVTDHYQAILAEQQAALMEAQRLDQETAPSGSIPPGAAPEASNAAAASPGRAEGAGAGTAALAAKEDGSATGVRVAVSVGEVELELHRHLEGLPNPLPLARLTLADLWVTFRNTQQGSMWVGVCLPRVEARDLRPEVPPEQSLVISSAHKASFLVLDWAAGPGTAHQALALTLQKPLLVAELSFLLAVTQFAVPTFAFVKDRPIPYVTHDIALSGEPHRADADLFLCPAVRLLADAPGVHSFEYDGGGHCLVLPDKDNLDEPLPLILVGSGATLRLRNLHLVNAASLAVCLQLAPGARLLASTEDGVELVDSLEADAELAHQLTAGNVSSPTASGALARTLSPTKQLQAPTSPQRGSGPARLSPSTRRQGSSAPSSMPAQLTGAPSGPQQQQHRTIEISLSAVGLGLQFVHLAAEGSGGPARASGSGASSGAATRHGSVQDLALAAPQQQQQQQQLASQAALAAPLSARQAGGGRAVQMLAASLDLSVAYKIEDTSQRGHVEVQGLRAETRFISDAAASLAQREQRDLQHKRKLRGKREGGVLDPCRLALDFNLSAGGEEPDGAPAVTDVRLDASELRLTVSPDVLELGGALASSVLAPLMQPKPDAPLASCTQFEHVWSFNPSELFAGQQGGRLAVSLAVTGAEGGLTVWRAKAPTGYAVAGSIVTPGVSQPTFEVLALAVNSGLVAYPAAYSRLWAGAGGAIWRALPPPGYVAAGDLFTAGEEEPELSAMVCLHEGTLVECPLGERLTLPPQLPHAPSVEAAAAAALPRLELWCLDNSLGTFWAATAQLQLPEHGHDLRNPLGVTPAALLAMGAAAEESASWAVPGQRQRQSQPGGEAATPPESEAQPAPGTPPLSRQSSAARLAKRQDAGQMFRSFQDSRRELRTEAVARLVTPAIVDFRRVWGWAGDGTSSSQEGVSIWRPLAPPGYASLGDCLVRGHDPPPSVCVVQDTGPAEGLGAPAGQPLVQAPRGFQPVWEDSAAYADSRLVLWRPVPYPGYVSMGCVASVGTDPPPRSCVKCLRADAAARASPGRVPVWSLRRESRTPPPVAAWTVDERLHTFVAASGGPEAALPPHDAWKLRQPASEQAEVPGGGDGGGGGVNVVIKAAAAAVVLQDPFHVPLLEVCLGSVEAGVRGPSQAVVQAYLGFKLGVWAYHAAVRAWEPVLEPWDVIAQCAANSGTRMASGIEPGVSVSVKTSNDCVYATLAYSALSSALTAYSDWQQLHVGGRRLLAAGEASAMRAVVENRLGVEAAMELDFGDRLEVVKLEAGSDTPVVKPLPSLPARQAGAAIAADALPHALLLLDVRQARCTFDAAAQADEQGMAPRDAAGEQSRQLYCSVSLEAGSAAATPTAASPAGSAARSSGGGGFQASVAAPLRTRARALGGDGVVSWQERLIVAMPMRPAAEQALVFEVWDAAARGGQGASLGSARLSVPVRDLKHREEHGAELTWEGFDGTGTVQLQLGYMLQEQWALSKLNVPPPGQNGGNGDLSTTGQRALSLTSQPGCWAVIPAYGQHKGAASGEARGGAAATAVGSVSVTPLQIGKEGLVVESSVANGTHREVLRAMCQLVNSTELTLEACLVDVEDGDWHMVAARSGSISGSVSADSVEEEVFENERFARGLPGGGTQWAAANLRPGGDPARFQYALRQASEFPRLDPPEGWEWESSWQVDHGPATDPDGWAYAPDFKQLHFPPPPGSHRPSLSDHVRRRRWVRRRRRAGGRPFPIASAAAAAAAKAISSLGPRHEGQTEEDEGYFIVKERQVLGRAAPGEALPLPLGWSAPGKQLQLRPVLPAAAGEAGPAAAAGQAEEGQAGSHLPEGEQEEGGERLRAAHDWSRGTSGGRQTLALDSLSEGITRLVCCPSLHSTPLGSASQLEVADLWFSLAVDSELLAASKQAQPMSDWRIVVTAPLRLVNQLPVAGSLLVWEGAAGPGRELAGRQTVQVESGATVPIHTADMRRAVSFTFYPEGYDWVEPTPTLLSEGHSGRGHGRQQLPDRFRLARPSASVPVEVFVHRTIELGSWLLDAKEELDPGAAVAMGVPLSVALLSPLWVVNATSLAIDAAITPLEAPPPKPAASQQKPGRRQTGDGLRDTSLRVVNTDGSDPSQRVELRGRRFVAPTSLELLSYPLPSYLGQSASQQQLGGGGGSGGREEAAQRARAQRRQLYGVRLRVAGSGWTPALALDAPELGAAGAQGAPQQDEDLQAARPVLIRALARDSGLVHEVVARLEVTAFGTSQVLRLEPHVVVSNRTSVPLQLLQSRLELAAAAAGGAPPAPGRPAGAVVAEGGISFSQPSYGSGLAPATSAGSFLVRPSARSLSSAWWHGSSGSSLRQDSDASSLAPDSFSFASRAGVWERLPSQLLPGAAPLVQMSASSFRQQQERGGVLDVPAGAASVPLPLTAGLPYHSISFRCVPPPEYAAAAAADALPLWSRPVTIREGAEAQLHVLVPVIQPEGADEHAHGGADTAHLTPTASAAAAAAARGTSGGFAAVAILRLSVHRRGAGAMHVVLESMHGEPPYLLENRTAVPLQYRQAHVRDAPFHTLPPLSAAGYVWEFSMASTPHELELREAGAVGVLGSGGGGGTARVYALAAPEEGEGEQPAAATRMQPLPLAAAPHQCSVRVAYWEQVTVGPTGVVRLGGEGSGVLGRGGVDRVMLVAPGHEPLLTEGAQSLQASHSAVSISFQLPGLEVSLVDHTPRELLLLTATDLRASVAWGSNPASAYKSMRFSVHRLQLDDVLPGTPFPVVLAAAQQQPGRGGAAAQPLLAVTVTSVLGGSRGRSYMPLVAVRWPVAVQLAVSEALVWSLQALVQRLQRSLAAAAEAGDGGGAVAAADVPVRIRLLAVDSLRTQVSFQGDPFSRPRDLAGGLLGSIIDLANFQAAPISLQGLSESNVVMLQSALTASILHHIRSQLFYVTLSLMRNFGLIGGTSRALGALSAAVSKLAAGSASAAAERAEAKQKRAIADIGDGVLEGAGAIGSSFLRGVRGLVEKPLQGARAAGVEGAVKGIGKGIIGAVASPVSGVLDALSAAAEGVDATFGRPKDQLLVLERRRPARVVTGEGRLLPLLRDGSTNQSRVEEVGQALLRNTLLSTPDGLRRKRAGAAVTEAYEEHFVMPEDRVALLTSAGLLLVHAPGFTQLDGAAEIGAAAVSDVPPGELQWQVRWDDVLALELRWSREMRYPDRLVVHRKGRPGAQEEESLAHELKCFENTPQAPQVKLEAEQVLRKYHLDPLLRDKQWSARHDAATRLPPGTALEQLPLSMLCMDFALTWHTNLKKQPVVSFWRPVAPAGYRAVGDVAVLGLEPPSAPVPCFRDDAGRRPDPGAGEPPLVAHPKEFSLIWRYNGQRPVTMWMPLAPPGYSALGAVVRGEPAVPDTDGYLCVRSDLTAATGVFNSPLWRYDPQPALQAAAAQLAGASRAAASRKHIKAHHPETWKVSVWQVDNRLGTFVAMRSLDAPPPGVPRTVVSIEEREASRHAQKEQAR